MSKQQIPQGRDPAVDRVKRLRGHGVAQMPHPPEANAAMAREYAIECGWGRILFAQTFADAKALADATRAEGPDQRDIVFYVHEPHVALAAAPQELFLDPSHTYRLDLSIYRPATERPRGFFVRRLTSLEDAEAINRIYQTRNMVPVAPEFFWAKRDARTITYFVAEDAKNGEVIGTVTGIDHSQAFGDPEHTSSLWCLAVDPQAQPPGVGEALVRRLAEHFKARGASCLDLSVLHDNDQAIALYEKLGFVRVPYFTVKRRNPINEKLFVGPALTESMNPYATIIIDEARRRGIAVQVTDAEGGFFRLTYGGRSVHCRESLSEFTSGVAMSICDDKAVTRRVVKAAGVVVPEQIEARRVGCRGVPRPARRGGGQAGTRRTGTRRRCRPRDDRGGRGGDRRGAQDFRPGPHRAICAWGRSAAGRHRQACGGGGDPPSGADRRRWQDNDQDADREAEPAAGACHRWRIPHSDRR